jgi:hypothetical protein
MSLATIASGARIPACTLARPSGMTLGPFETEGLSEASTVASLIHRARRRRTSVNELIRYLLENMYLDFQGEITLEKVRSMLKDDGSREARNLLEKLTQDNGIDDMLITLADTLKDYLGSGINNETVREQLSLYAES